MKMVLTVLVLLICVSFVPLTQAWDYTGPTGAARSVQQTYDGGYIIGATANLIKLDSTGTMTWRQPTVGAFVGACAAQALDSGYIFAGAENHDGKLVRTNSTGDTLWTHHYGSATNDELLAVLPTSDSGFIAAGYYAGPTIGNPNSAGRAWLLRVDAQGGQIWSQTYETSGDNRIYGMARAQGGFVLAGRTKPTGAGNYDFLVIRVNDGGDTLWYRTYDGRGGDDMAASVAACTDGGFIVTGYTTPTDRTDKDLWILKLDSTGTEQWASSFGDVGNDYGEAIQQTHDGNYIVCGYTSTATTSATDMWVLKVDTTGDTLWTQTVGTTNYDAGLSVIQNRTGGYVCAGLTNSSFIFFGNGNDWVFSIDSTDADTGTAVSERPATVLPNKFQLSPVYPNPFNSTATIRYSLPRSSMVEIDIINTLGQTESKLVHEAQSPGTHTLSFVASQLPSGVYFVRLRTVDGLQMQKVVLLK